MKTELKPCPFCGNKKIVVKNRYVTNHSVIKVARFSAQCTRCHARSKPITGAYRYSYLCEIPEWVERTVRIETKEALETKAIRAWNVRVDDEN